ncbi:acyltransferase [uncultured Enterobacter sp.]|uniref:acyltransferase family protein n=1 Tax=uncultured Enterobacter sp. TaxID=238202 RepID=UPI00262AE966|nr:acyltransferase [uncultured Enterobacter sp.]
MNLQLIWILFCILSASFIFGFRKDPFIPNRNYNIDGLRYLLAAFVAFHHNSYSEIFFKTGSWKVDDTSIAYIGTFGVAVFFMITGYLFGETKSHSNWALFFTKRFLRIIPMCFFSSICCVVLAAYIGNLTTQTNHIDILYWFDGGITGIRPDLFGYQKTNLINAGVTWSLYWEWAFYFSLPLLSFLFNKKYTVGLCITAIALFINVLPIFKIPTYNISFLIFFAIGVLVRNLNPTITDKFINLKDILAISILVYCIFFSGKSSAYNFYSCIFVGLFFYLIISGSNLFGILTSRGFLKLGDASYSIYLLHGIGWFIMNKFIFHYEAQVNTLFYYVIQTITWYMICYASLLTYKYIETPFIKLAKKFPFKAWKN